jgi:hypothetical protein
MTLNEDKATEQEPFDWSEIAETMLPNNAALLETFSLRLMSYSEHPCPEFSGYLLRACLQLLSGLRHCRPETRDEFDKVMKQVLREATQRLCAGSN